LLTYSVVFFYVRFLESVLESTFNLLSASPVGGFASAVQGMTPLHFQALVDPKATWFKKWMVRLAVKNYDRKSLSC